MGAPVAARTVVVETWALYDDVAPLWKWELKLGECVPRYGRLS